MQTPKKEKWGARFGTPTKSCMIYENLLRQIVLRPIPLIPIVSIDRIKKKKSSVQIA